MASGSDWAAAAWSGVDSEKNSTAKSRRDKYNVPALDKDLIRHANAAGTFVDYGDAGQRAYKANVEAIKSMDMSDEEKQSAINELHKLTTAQLEAESKAQTPYSAGVGPARFNKEKMAKAGDKALSARSKTETFMNNLKKQQADKERKAAAKAESDALTSAFKNAIANKALSFTVNGQTWTRKSLRSKTFTSR